VLASVVGGASKLAIRKSWIMEHEREAAAEAVFSDRVEAIDEGNEETGNSGSSSRNNNNNRSNSSSNSNRSIHVPVQTDTFTAVVTAKVLETPEDGFTDESNPRGSCEPLPADEPITDDDDDVVDMTVGNANNNRNADFRRTGRMYTALPDTRHGPQSTTTVTTLAAGDDDPLVPDSHEKSRCCCCCTVARLLRLAGMFGMTFVNPAFCVIAMNYASPSILAPFSGLTLVWVIVLSEILIGESPTLLQKVASSLIILGEIMVAIFGDHTNDQGVTLASLEASYKEFSFILYFVGVALWMFLMIYWIRSPTPSTLQRFAWGSSGGSVTGIAQCFIKDSLVILKKSDSLFHWPWYLPLFVFLAIAFSFGGLLFLTATMKRYDATYSAAMFVGSFVVSASIMSAAHYHTFENLDTVIEYIMYPAGLITLMIGVYILVLRGTQSRSIDEVDHETADDNFEPVVVLLDHPYEAYADATTGGAFEKEFAKGYGGTLNETQRTESTVESNIWNVEDTEIVSSDNEGCILPLWHEAVF